MEELDFVNYILKILSNIILLSILFYFGFWLLKGAKFKSPHLNRLGWIIIFFFSFVVSYP